MNIPILAVTTPSSASWENAERDASAALGFWIYILADCILFAALFATFAVLRGNRAGGPAIGQVFHPPYVLAETLILLASSFTCGLGWLAVTAGLRGHSLSWFGATWGLGLGFISMEFRDFAGLLSNGKDWSRSGALSSYFTLVGTHGIHIAIGLLWLAVLMLRTWRQGVDRAQVRRFTYFAVFWHFLDMIWIFIFTIVYMVGLTQL